jgi:hypothetical protein
VKFYLLLRGANVTTIFHFQPSIQQSLGDGCPDKSFLLKKQMQYTELILYEITKLPRCQARQRQAIYTVIALMLFATSPAMLIKNL